MKLLNKILNVPCYYIWHDWQDTNLVPPGIMSGESWYWTLEWCSKCHKERGVMRV